MFIKFGYLRRDENRPAGRYSGCKSTDQPVDLPAPATSTTMTHRMSRFTLALPMLLAACTGSSDPPPEDAPSDVIEQFEPPDCEPSELCLDPPASGFQIRSDGTLIQPGEDVEYCEVVALPGTPDDTYYVRAFESQMTEGSHHLIIAGIVPESDTDHHAEVGDRVPCTGPDVFGGELVPVTGSQKPYEGEAFPPGVGRVFTGGQKVVFDYHYFNTTPEPIQARAAVNFHTTTADKVTKLSQSFGFYNLGIEIPPGAAKAFTAECFFDGDVYVHSLTRHTHQWGTEFNTWFAGGPRDGELVFSSPDYETVSFPFEEPTLVRGGEGFRFECAFENNETYTLKFGLKASDEMCILFGSWYEAMEGQNLGNQSCFVFD